MAKFTIRIELNNASSETYENLHLQLHNNEVYKTIIDTVTKIEYYLPRGLYLYEGVIEEKENMLEFIEAIVKKLSKDYEIVVTKSLGIHGAGLKKVKH